MTRIAYDILKEQQILYDENFQIIPQKDYFEVITPFTTPLGDGIMMNVIYYNGLYLADDCMDTLFTLSSLGINLEAINSDIQKILIDNKCELTHDESITSIHPSMNIAIMNLVCVILEIYNNFLEIKTYDTTESR